MQTANKLFVIGIGYRPLEQRARELVLNADVLLASSRLHEVFRRYAEYETVKSRIKVINKVPDTIVFIREQLLSSTKTSVVLLGSGDPFFFGIGRRMVQEFGKERVEVLPDLSSMQQAFSRINEPWDDAFFISLHGGPDIAKRRKLPFETKDLPMLLERHGKLGILTDRQNNPAEIARVVKAAFCDPHSALEMHVCEHLGYDDERIWTGTIDEAASMIFADPNVVILLKPEVRSQKSEAGRVARSETRQQEQTLFGLREDEIAHERGLITKDEVRAVTIHKLRLSQQGVLWDIGAGSGSVSLEAARLFPGLRIFAVEKEPRRVEDVLCNRETFGVRNVDVITGTAPEALAGLPAPDRVFIGGSSGNLGDIVKFVRETMSSGIIVVNAATLETLNDAVTFLERSGFSAEVTEISVSRSKIVGGKRLMNALNPVFIITGEKG